MHRDIFICVCVKISNTFVEAVKLLRYYRMANRDFLSLQLCFLCSHALFSCILRSLFIANLVMS